MPSDLAPAEAVLDRWWGIAAIRANPLSEQERAQSRESQAMSSADARVRDWVTPTPSTWSSHVLLVDETVGRAFAVRVPKASNRTDPKHYAGSVSTRAAPNGEGFEVVVGTDGALTVPAEELARHGVRPGAQLRLVQEGQPRASRRSVRGALAGVIDAEELDAFEVALDNSKAERITAAERRWG